MDEVKQYIDLLALYKFNSFHWHLTDDQGWRIEIKQYPKLTEVGGWRNGTMVGRYSDQQYDSIRYGGYYTQEEIREVVDYAAKRHINIVPEIEMPGHATAALAAYPNSPCTGGPFEVAQGWGVFPDIFVRPKRHSLFLENILDEVMALFPLPSFILAAMKPQRPLERMCALSGAHAAGRTCQRRRAAELLCAAH